MSKLSSFRYTWGMFDADIRTICNHIDFSNYDVLIGISSGGLPLLTTLKNKTNLPYHIIKCESYIGHEQQELVISGLDTFHGVQKRILVLDDVADSGFTLDKIKEKLSKNGNTVETLTLCYKPESIVVPTWYLHEVSNDLWIEFPWE